MLKISGQRLVFALFGNFFWRYIFPGQIKPPQVRKFGITAKNSLASYYFTQYVFATSSKSYDVSYEPNISQKCIKKCVYIQCPQPDVKT